MRVLWVNHRDSFHPLAGGAEVHLRETAERLVALGHQVTVLAENHAAGPSSEQANGVRYLRMGSRLSLHALSLIYLSTHSGEFDVVIDDIAHAVPFWSPLVTSKPVVAWVHHVHQSVLSRELSPFLSGTVRLAERSIRGTYRHIVAVSESTKRDLIRELGLPGESIVVIPYGIDHSVYSVGHKFFEPTILWMGGFKPYKNAEDVIRAFALLKLAVPEARLILAGKGRTEEVLRGLSVSLGLSDSVSFPGWVVGAEKVRLLQGAWCLVYSSDIEGWGMGILEAGASGTPSVAYAVGAIPEAIADGRSGLLVRPRDVRDLAKKLILVCRDSNLRRHLEAGAFSKASEYDWNRSVKLTLNYLNSIL